MKNKKQFEKEREELNERFYYLPENGITAAVIASPFLLYAGLEAERFQEIIEGSEPDFAEIDLIIWACDIGLNLISASTTEDLLDKTDTINEAMEIAAEYLDQQNARKALDLTIRTLKDKEDIRKKFN